MSADSFWIKLKKEKNGPIIVLAPMADVTDASFRRVIAARGKPDVIWTEFVSADGIFLGGESGRNALMRDLIFTEAERPIIAQFFTSRPENMEKAAVLATEMGFDGIDINMGCPDKGIERQGAGAALIKNPKLARELIQATKKGAAEAAKKKTAETGVKHEPIPVSVKTRIGFNVNQLETWLPELLAEEPAVITVHARTRKEMSKVPARWEEVKRAVEIRNTFQKKEPPSSGSETLIFGNGDVMTVADAHQKAVETGCDGVMMGRAIFGNPWLFSSRPVSEISPPEKLETLVEHTKLFEQLLGKGDPKNSHPKNFAIMKKHFKAYVTGWDGAKELRMQLMETENADEVEKIIREYKTGLI